MIRLYNMGYLGLVGRFSNTNICANTKPKSERNRIQSEVTMMTKLLLINISENPVRWTFPLDAQRKQIMLL